MLITIKFYTNGQCLFLLHYFYNIPFTFSLYCSGFGLKCTKVMQHLSEPLFITEFPSFRCMAETINYPQPFCVPLPKVKVILETTFPRISCIDCDSFLCVNVATEGQGD